MGNASIPRLFDPKAPSGRDIYVPKNGILAQIGGAYIAEASQQLPPPDQSQEHERLRKVEIEVPQLGLVQITYELMSFRRGRSRNWAWLAIYAEQAKEKPPEGG